MDQFVRTRLLLSEEGMEKLKGSRVAVFGIGGVGGFATEALVRSGVGAIDLIDHDRVSLSNLNRQIIALHSTVGRFKTEVMRERMLDINPEAEIREFRSFFLPEEKDKFPFAEYDYIIDAVDTVTAKIGLVMAAEEYHVPIISSMGAGNKLDPAMFEVADIYKTSVCPLAKVMRRELKKRGIRKLKVVYSKEVPITPGSENLSPEEQEELSARRSTPGSIAFVPSAAGLILAGEVIRDLAGISRS